MSNTVLIKRSGTSSTVPSTLQSGEIAINYADGKLFYKNAADAIVGSKLISNITGTSNQITVSETSGTFALSLPSSVYVNSLFVDGIEIDTTGATPSYVLAYNGTKFVPTISSASISLNEISDVVITSPQSGEVIKYDGSQWINNLETGYNNSYATVIGDGIASQFSINHNFGTRDVFVQCRNNNSPYENIEVRWEATTDNQVTLDFSTIPSSSSIRVNVYASVGVVGPSAFSQTIGDGIDDTFNIEHNLQTRDVLVSARNSNSPYEVIEINWKASTENIVEAIFSSPPSSNSVRITVYAAAGASGVTSINGTTNEIEVNQSTGGVTVGLPNNVSISGDLTVGGNVTINGDTTTINTATLSVEDNIVILNSNVTSSPTTNAGLEVERGTSDNVLLRWNETSDKWQLTNDGTNYYDILSKSSSIDDFLDVVITSATPNQFLKWDGSQWINGDVPQINTLDDIGDVSIATATSGQFLKFNGSNWINSSIPIINSIDDIGDVVLTDSSQYQILSYDGSDWVNSNLNAINGVSYIQNIGDASATSFTITHNLGTRDVYVVFVKTISPYDVIDVTWQAATINSITATISPAPALNSVRAIIYAGLSTAQGSSYTASVGNGTDTEITVTHNLNTRDIFLSCVLNESPYNDVNISWEALTANTVKLYFSEAPDSNQIKVNIFANVNGSSVGQSVTSLTDTNITSVTTGQFLKWDGTEWINANIPTINTLDDVGDVTISSAASGQFLKWNGSAWVNDAVDLGTDTTGDYVQSIVAGTGISLSNNSGEGATPTITNTGVVSVNGSSGVVTGIATTSGNLSQFGSTTSSQLAGVISDETGSGSLVFGTSPTVTTSLLTGSSSFNLFNTTATTINFAGAATVLNIGAATGITTINNNLVVTGDLTVSGTTTTINTTELLIEDNLIVLNTGSAATPSYNAGIEIERGDFTNVQIRWNESTGKWQFTNDGTTYKDLGSGGVTVSDTIPVAPGEGDMWYESDTGGLFAFYDSQWIEIGGSAAYNEIIGTIQSKGDLLAGTASQTLSRIGVGANNTRLIADSTQTTGLRWAPDTQNNLIDAKGDLLAGSADNTIAKVSVGGDGQVLMANSLFSTGVTWSNPLTNKNLFINGGFAIDQRGKATSHTVTAGSALEYTVDRWYEFCTGANVTAARTQFSPSAGLPYDVNYQYTFTGATSNTLVGFGQRIEAINATSVSGSFCTLSAVLYSSVSKVVTWTAYYANSSDSFGTLASPTRTQIATGTFTTTTLGASPTSSNKFSTYFQVTANQRNGIEIVFTCPSLTAGQTLTIANVQFEQGLTPTPFEQRPIGVELALCQRYYYRIFPNATLKILGTYCFSINTSTAQAYGCFPVPMRVAPTALEQSGTASNYSVSLPGTVNNSLTSVPTFSTVTTSTEWGVTVGTSAVLGAHNPYSFRTDPTTGANAFLGWSAEL